MGRVSTCQKNCNTIDLRRAQVNNLRNGVSIVYSTVYSGTDQRKHQYSASLAFNCEGISPGTCEFPAQMVSSAGNGSIWWRHHERLHTPLEFNEAAMTKNTWILESP